MPSQALSSVENNFTKGLVTEFTGLNFPENAATDCDNVRFDEIGNCSRRLGIDVEDNFSNEALGNRSLKAINTFRWDNAGGDGISQIVVTQTGDTLAFYLASDATVAAPISTQLIDTLDLTPFTAPFSSFDEMLECQFTSGNGYLFVFHPNIDPMYVTYTGGNIDGYSIQGRIRDFIGVIDNLGDDTRPSTLSNEHNYNLLNQGWTSSNPWFAQSTSSNTVTVGAHVFTVPAGIAGITPGQSITCQAYDSLFGVRQPRSWMGGSVTSYVGTALTVNINSVTIPYGTGPYVDWDITPSVPGIMNAWFTALSNYPSNSDQWWRYKDSTGAFAPTSAQTNALGLAPKGHYTVNPWYQDRNLSSGLTGLNLLDAQVRPTHGAWFQGRLWMSGVNSSQAAIGNAEFTTWTESIYFSQVVNKPADFGNFFQVNDPTSESLFDLLPTDGGVIVVPGAGPIYKLWPTQNGLLVFSGTGVRFITGSQGIGFAATDYTVVKISDIQSISSSSFVNVNGLPYFWNEEGIYRVITAQNGSLTVERLTFATIDTYYAEIPMLCKKFARGAYNPIDYTVQWIFTSEVEENFVDRYTFDRILNFSVKNGAFYPFSLTVDDTFFASINGIEYIQAVGGTDTDDGKFKYWMSHAQAGVFQYSFADEHDEFYADWRDVIPTLYDSYFVTGYKLRGQGQRRFQMPYIYMYSNNNEDTQYKIQSIWDYTTSGNSGRWSSQQLIINSKPNYGVVIRRHRLRGQGLVLQIRVSSVDQQPFSIIGWSAYETQNTGV